MIREIKVTVCDIAIYRNIDTYNPNKLTFAKKNGTQESIFEDEARDLCKGIKEFLAFDNDTYISNYAMVFGDSHMIHYNDESCAFVLKLGKMDIVIKDTEDLVSFHKVLKRLLKI